MTCPYLNSQWVTSAETAHCRILHSFFHRGLRDAARQRVLKCPGRLPRAQPSGLGVSENTFAEPAAADEIH